MHISTDLSTVTRVYSKVDNKTSVLLFNMISRELKEKAIELRKLGKSYREIEKETSVRVGMLSYWFSKMEWSQNVLKQNKKRNREESRRRILLINRERTVNLGEKYRLVEEEAIQQFGEFKNDSLFIAALMLYLGEGDKSALGHSVRIGNIDPPVLKIFIKFALKYCDKSINEVRFWVLCYPDLDVQTCENWWMKQLGLKQENLYKTQVIQGKHKTKRLRYGVGNIILGNKSLKVKILKWIDLMCTELC